MWRGVGFRVKLRYTKRMQEERQNYWQPDAGVESEEEAFELPELVQWQASEYIHHEKNAGWYVALVLAGLLLIISAILFLDSITFVVLIVVMVAALWFFAMRPPRTMRYQLTPHTLHVNDHVYGLQEFRSFGLVQEGGIYSIALNPAKRYMPRLSLYFPPEQGEEILVILETMLPEEEVRFDMVDRLTRRLRF